MGGARVSTSLSSLKYRDKRWLLQQYWENGRSTCDIATELGCNPGTIYYWLQKHGILVRRVLEHHVSLSPPALQFLEGELLGDGGLIYSSGQKSARFAYSSKHYDYLMWLASELQKMGIQQSGDLYKQTRGECYWWQYQSRHYRELATLKRRWYPEGKKVVPEDIELAPVVARQWYLGDGSLCRSRRQRAWIEFCTDGFALSCVRLLADKLAALGFNVTFQPKKNRVRMSASSVSDFFDYIGPCPPEIEHVYGYKWDISPSREDNFGANCPWERDNYAHKDYH